MKYIDGIMPKLEEKYNEIYLVRNEKDVRILVSMRGVSSSLTMCCFYV